MNRLWLAPIVTLGAVLLARPVLVHGQAGSAPPKWQQTLPPALRPALTDVRVLTITTNNLDVIWDLGSNPRRADVVVLTVPSTALSSSQIDAVREWVSTGRGLVLNAKNVNSFGRVPVVRIGHEQYWCVGVSYNGVEGTQYGMAAVPAEPVHPLAVGVGRILVASSTTCSSGVANHEYGNYVFQREETSQFAVVFEGSAEDGDAGGAQYTTKPLVLAGPLGRGRILVLGGGYDNIDFAAGRVPFGPADPKTLGVFDTARFYVNALLWLTGRAVPR